MPPMTMRQRILAVIQGHPHDRVPFVQYDNIAARNEDIWSLIGRGKMGLLRWSGVHRIEHPNCRIETEGIWRGSIRGQRAIMHTPAGQLVEERFFEPTYGAGSIKSHYVKDPDDYRVFMAYLRDAVVLPDYERYLRDWHDVGDDGLPLTVVPQTPFQQLWIDWVGLDDLCAHLVECPDIVEECISMLARIERRVYETVRRAADQLPLRLVDIPDNITAPVIGLKRFRKYCVPLYNELADMLADRGIPVFVHMDGDLRPLWQAIGESRVGGIDSLSPPPDNDTSAGQAITLWPGMRVFVNYPSSVHLAEPDEIYRQAQRILDEAGHSGRLMIQVGENVPPGVWRKSFPQIVRAIDDFGTP